MALKESHITILGIETSCDETAAAVVTDGRQVRSSGKQIGHVHIHSFEPGAIECRGHLHVPVDSLFAQNRYSRPPS